MKFTSKVYPTFLFFVLISLVLAVFIIYPALKDIKNGSEKILFNRKKTAFIYKQSQELNKIKENLQDHQSNLTLVENLFVDRENPVKFLKFLEETARDSNLEVNISFIKTEGEASGNPVFSSFRIYAKGEFENILKFYRKLEKGNYLIEVDNLSINSSTKKGNEAEISNIIETIFLVRAMNKQL